MDFRALTYETGDGRRPFDEWLDKLRKKDRMGAAAIDARIARIRDKGNWGDHASVGQSVYELRLHVGPGYRVYYLRHGEQIIVLLAGGIKKRQRQDITRAHEFAADFWRRI